MELILGIAHIELDEGPGQLLGLPGRGRFAGAQPDDGVADPDCLAGPHGQIARQAVALVEEAEHRDPLRHRSGPRGLGGDCLRHIDRARFGRILAGLLAPLAARLRSAGRQSKQRRSEQAWGSQTGRLGQAAHSSPGVQAS